MQRFLFKKIECKELIASFNLSSEMHVSKYELLFILNCVSVILEQYRIFLQTNFVALLDPIKLTSSLQSALYFHYYNDYNVVGVRIRFGIRLPNAYIQKIDSKNETFPRLI